MTEVIEFSGGRESMKLAFMFKDKKPRPILVTYLPEGDTAGLVPIFQYFADKEGYEIKFVFGKEDGNHETWLIEEPIGFPDFYVTGWNSNILKLIRKKVKGVTVVYTGRKKIDLYERKLIPNPQKDVKLGFNSRPKVVFPLWNEK